jgi:hypothetical protein
VAAVVVIINGDGSATVGQTAHLALSAATMPAPTQSASDRTLLDLRVARIPSRRTCAPSDGRRAAPAETHFTAGR